MKIGTGSQLRSIDSYAINKIGIAGLVLMERAGLSVSTKVINLLKDNKANNVNTQRVAIVCGTGNNGGDGYVIARHLMEYFCVDVYVVGDMNSIKGDAKANLNILNNMKIKVSNLKDEMNFNFEAYDVIVDCIFGTGLCRNVEGIYKRTIELINESKAMKISVDIPSGINADTGEVLGVAVEATKTFTFAIPKRGMYLYPGRDYCGEIVINDIGIPKEAVEAQNININLITQEYIKNYITKRRRNTNKGTYGKVLILGGSRGYTGAPILSSQGALYTGSGIVTLGIPDSLHDIAENKLTEVVTYPLKSKDYRISKSSIPEIKTLIDKNDAVAMGMGLGAYKDEKEGLRIISEILSYTDKPILIDADGLNLISKDVEVLRGKRGNVIITPHPGEMSRLAGLSIEYIEKNRIECAMEFSKRYGVCVVLKGNCTIIAYNDEVFINQTGNPGMAQGGSGDVLSGIIISLVGQGIDIRNATVCGVYLHGLAGDIACEETCEYGITALKVVEKIPNAIGRVLAI